MRSSEGTRRSFSQSRRVTRMRLASSESYSSDSSSGRRRSSSEPISSSTKRSCAMRPSVATASERAEAPSGGIVTRWSQKSTATLRWMSEISASRSRKRAQVGAHGR